MNLLQQLEQEQVDKLAASRPVPEFQPGDTLRVGVKVVEGERERIQVFEGVCIGRKNAGVNSNFTLRKISTICAVSPASGRASPNAPATVCGPEPNELARAYDRKPSRPPRWPARSKKPTHRSDRSHGPAAHPL
jgi:ribosomal protein L19